MVVWQSDKIYFTRYDRFWSSIVTVSNLTSQYPSMVVKADNTIHITFGSKDGRTGISSLYYATNFESNNFYPPFKIGNGEEPNIFLDKKNMLRVVYCGVGPKYGIYEMVQNWPNNNFTVPFPISVNNNERDPAVSESGKGHIGIVWTNNINSEKSIGFAIQDENNRIIYNGEKLIFMKYMSEPTITGDCNGDFHIAYLGKESPLSEWRVYYTKFTVSQIKFDTPVKIDYDFDVESPRIYSLGNFVVVSFIDTFYNMVVFTSQQIKC